jgi:hypothetical protein
LVPRLASRNDRFRFIQAIFERSNLRLQRAIGVALLLDGGEQFVLFALNALDLRIGTGAAENQPGEEQEGGSEL